jgi:hypothetical protein
VFRARKVARPETRAVSPTPAVPAPRPAPTDERTGTAAVPAVDV